MPNLFKKYSSLSFVGLAYGQGASRSRGQPVVSDVLDRAEQGLVDRIHKRLLADADSLEETRLARVDAIDARIRLLLPAASLAGFLFGAIALQSIIAGLFLMLLCAAGAVTITLGLADRHYRLAAKPEVVAMLAPFVDGCLHDPNPSNDVKRFEAWKLFPQIKRVELEDRMLCARGGEDIAISRVRFSFGPGKSKSRNKSLNIAAIATEIGSPDQHPQDTIVIVGMTAGMTFRTAPGRRHKLQPFQTDDTVFNGRYLTFTSNAAAARSVLTSTVRDALSELETMSRADASAFLSNLPSSTGQKSLVVLQPGYTAIVTPLPKFDTAFEPGSLGYPMQHGEAAKRYAQDVIARRRDIEVARAFHAAVTGPPSTGPGGRSVH